MLHDFRAGIKPGFHREIELQGAVGDFDHQMQVFGLRAS
jgi:hypothetical protein